MNKNLKEQKIKFYVTKIHNKSKMREPLQVIAKTFHKRIGIYQHCLQL